MDPPPTDKSRAAPGYLWSSHSPRVLAGRDSPRPELGECSLGEQTRSRSGIPLEIVPQTSSSIYPPAPSTPQGHFFKHTAQDTPPPPPLRSEPLSSFYHRFQLLPFRSSAPLCSETCGLAHSHAAGVMCHFFQSQKPVSPPLDSGLLQVPFLLLGTSPLLCSCGHLLLGVCGFVQLA